MMLQGPFIQYVWLPVIVWMVIYTLDYTQTLRGARMYRTSAQQHWDLAGSYELNPFYQQDIDKLRRVSPRFLLMLALTSLLIVLWWWLSIWYLYHPNVFLAVLGALYLMEAVVHLRHQQTLLVFRYLEKHPGEVKGSIAYPRRLTLESSAAQFASFAVLYAACWLITGSWFFAGGVFSCLLVAARHRNWLKKAQPAAEAGPADSATG